MYEPNPMRMHPSIANENEYLVDLLNRLNLADDSSAEFMSGMKKARQRSVDAKMAMSMTAIRPGLKPKDSIRFDLSLQKRLDAAEAELRNLESIHSSFNDAGTLIDLQDCANQLTQELEVASKQLRQLRTENARREKELTKLAKNPIDLGRIEDGLRKELFSLRARNSQITRSIDVNQRAYSDCLEIEATLRSQLQEMKDQLACSMLRVSKDLSGNLRQDPHLVERRTELVKTIEGLKAEKHQLDGQLARARRANGVKVPSLALALQELQNQNYQSPPRVVSLQWVRTDANATPVGPIKDELVTVRQRDSISVGQAGVNDTVEEPTAIQSSCELESHPSGGCESVQPVQTDPAPVYDSLEFESNVLSPKGSSSIFAIPRLIIPASRDATMVTVIEESLQPEDVSPEATDVMEDQDCSPTPEIPSVDPEMSIEVSAVIRCLDDPVDSSIELEVAPVETDTGLALPDTVYSEHPSGSATELPEAHMPDRSMDGSSEVFHETDEVVATADPLEIVPRRLFQSTAAKGEELGEIKDGPVPPIINLPPVFRVEPRSAISCISVCTDEDESP